MKTLIAMIVDRSGSMARLQGDTIGSYNAFIEEQKAVPGEADICLTLFSSEVEVGAIHDIKLSEPMTNTNYIPGGMTALYDAMGLTIDAIGNHFQNGGTADKVIVCTITDGEENSSHKYTSDKVREMVKHQTDVYGWTFLFLGANIDAFAVGGSLGVQRQHTQSYDATSKGVYGAYRGTSSLISSMRLND